MLTVLAFIMTLMEVLGLVFAYIAQAQGLFSDLVINGSPFYLIMNIFNSSSPFRDGKPIYMAYLIFHVFKYLFLFRGRISDEYPRMAISAIFLEIIYLGTSAYYLY